MILPVKTEKLIKDYNLTIPLKDIYNVSDIGNYHYGDIELKKESITFKGESNVYKNELSLIVDSYETKKYVGFYLEIINEEISDEFLLYFNTTYGSPLKKYENIKWNYKDQIYMEC